MFCEKRLLRASQNLKALQESLTHYCNILLSYLGEIIRIEKSFSMFGCFQGVYIVKENMMGDSSGLIIKL